MAIYTINYTESALDDIGWYRTFEQHIILDGIDVQLRAEPLTETRNRKPLAENNLGAWEVRIGKYRVFYTTDEATQCVEVRAVGHKEHNTLTIRGKEYLL
jgi:mRNA-degrading endonuclease RelE of RelBE toxin-antitoxin system